MAAKGIRGRVTSKPFVILFSYADMYRYMAAELLESNFKAPSADIFSLSVTAYELCQAPGYRGLPGEGDEWHALRTNRAPPLIQRSSRLIKTISQAMEQDASHRITTEELLKIAELCAADSTKDPLLLASKPSKPLFSRMSNSLSEINTNFGSISEADRVMTPTGDASGFRLVVPQHESGRSTALSNAVGDNAPFARAGGNAIKMIGRRKL